MKNKSHLLLNSIVLLIIFCSGCKKMDSTYISFIKDGEIRYSKVIDSVGFFPGNKRAKFSVYVSGTDIKSGKISWNDGSDSLIFIVENSEEKVAPVSFTINDIEEGNQTFKINTYDIIGNSSMGVEFSGFIYGDVYKESLHGRIVSNALSIKGSPKISWLKETDSTAIRSEIVYYSLTEDREITRVVPNDEEITRITDSVLEDSIFYRTIYLPEENAIDTFYSSFEKLAVNIAESGLLNKENYNALNLPDDADPLDGTYKYSNLWDNDLTTREGAFQSVITNPLYFSIDLGTEASLDSFRLWQWYNTGLFYGNANVKEFEVWGSDNPDPNGGMDSWTKLGDFEILKPSQNGGTSDDDMEEALRGHLFKFSNDIPIVRYLRFHVISDWTNKGRFLIQELDFYGIPE